MSADPRLILLGGAALAVGLTLLAALIHRRFYYLGKGRETALEPPPPKTEVRVVALGGQLDYQPLPSYVDLNVGEFLRILRPGRDELQLRVVSTEVGQRAFDSPRTRVVLEVNGAQFEAQCGMLHRFRNGIPPIEIDGVKIAVEITRLLFSGLRSGSSPFNSYKSFRLRGDVRMALWDGASSIMPGLQGAFVLDQEVWTRQRFGNWLHRTNYGIHGAIDIYSSQHGVPERVLSPVDGTVFKVYNADANSDDTRRNKVVNVFGVAAVGPENEKVLYRFQHLSEIMVDSGEKVRRGQVLGLTGHTGFNPRIGDHLHFEMRLNPSCLGFDKDDSLFATIPINPYNYLLEWYANGNS